MLGIFAMFFILFRNITLSIIGVVPNFLAAFLFLDNWLARYTSGHDDYNNCSNNYWHSS